MLESRYDAMLSAKEVMNERVIAYDAPRGGLPVYCLAPDLAGIHVGAIPPDSQGLPFPSFVIEYPLQLDDESLRAFVYVDACEPPAQGVPSDKDYLTCKLQPVAYGKGHRIVFPAASVVLDVSGDKVALAEIHGSVVLKAKTNYQTEICTAANELRRLLYLLSIRGIVTEAVEPPAALNKKRLKHGKAPLHPYILVKVGKVYDRHGNEVPEGERRTVTPHIRAGHSRMQPHGPRNTLRKPVFIPPTFVNYVDGAEAQNRPRIVTL